MAHNDTTIINIDSTETAVKMFDKFSRIKGGRRIEPLDHSDNISYAHRALYNEYNLQIGDTCFMIPPEFIMVNAEATSQSIVMLRQENTQKQKSGHHKRIILIDLVFNGMQQLNGYPVNGPEGIYYVDGLRQLLAQFKCAPFLPIINEMINGTYAIFTVALQSITMSTLDGFPGAMTVQITLQEVNLTPYIEMPDVCFRDMIDWDLFRFYYQRFLTETHEYKKLQSLPYNKEHNRFKISILDSIVFENTVATKKNLLSLIIDKEIVRTDENGNLCDTNYKTYIDSDKEDVTITSFQCGYSNILTNIQFADMRSPTVQFLGGMDTIYNITFETRDYTIIQRFESCQIENDTLTRDNTKLRSVGFVKLESELVEFTGSLFVAIESVTTNTVPGFPGLFNVQINCVSYDIGQSEREQLKGFMPFEDGGSKGHCIDQNWDGLKEKVRQDNYAEWKIRTTMEVYPDLHLPTYTEVNEFIGKCNAFRQNNNLSMLPYTNYPTNPIAMLHGNKVTEKSISGDLVHLSDIDSELYEYDIYVDPDFYVFYPASYESFMQEEEDYYGVSPTQRSSFTKTLIEENEPDYSGTGMGGSSNLAEQFIQACRSMISHAYVWGAAGPTTFDCSGLVTWALKEIGVMDAAAGRFTVETISTSSLFEEVPYNQRQRGDVICNYDLSHVVVCQGDGTIVHASNSAPYPQGGVKESNEYFEGRVFRAKAFINDASSGGAHNASGSSAEETAWNLLKSYGMTDIAAAGIMGNFGRETGGTYDPRIVQGGSYADYPISGAGYGLPQYTYGPYQTGLVAWSNQNGVGCNTAAGQIGYLMSLISGTNWYKAMNETNSIEEATRLFEENFEKAGVPAMEQRYAYANGIYQKYKGTGADVSDNTSTSKYNLTEEELDSICRYVYQETMGEPEEATLGVTQYIYDTITDTGIGLGAVLSTSRFPKGPYNGDVPEDIQFLVTSVFSFMSKRVSTTKIRDFIDTSSSSDATFKNRNDVYPYHWTIGSHTFWADGDFTLLEVYSIGAGNGSSTSGDTKVDEVTYDATTLDEDNLKYFAEPILARVDTMKYGFFNNIGIKWGSNNLGIGKTAQTFSREKLNSGINIFNTSFCNMYNYSGRGRLVRAFPAYLFCILDEDAQWYDGRKLWTNYYTHKSAIDIAVHATNDMPTETATITISNSYHNLDVAQGGLSKYKVGKDEGYFWNRVQTPSSKDGDQTIGEWWYQNTGMVPSITGPKVTTMLIELHSIIYQHAKIREGARVHLRMGYGSDPLGLAPMINGNVSDITLGDQITMIITSDGNELIHHLTSNKQKNKKDTNNGFLGLFGLGESQEASDIISKIMTKRQSWMSKLSDRWFEGSMYGIEHYGLYFQQNFGQSINNIWAGQKEQYDILKNVYTASYEREHYITCNWIFDREENVVFNQYNMTPWDVFQVCTQQAPEYILKSTYHQFDSRLYFGCPMWMEKYRYNLFGNDLYDECKSSTQCHFIDSMSCIIDNQIRVTSKFTNTNIKVMYVRGNTAQPTKLLQSDSTIDNAYQKTTIIDSPIVQDALGPDAFYEWLSVYKIGYKSAKRVGISNLLYGWQQEYQGQLLLLGEPGIRAHDYIMLHDSFVNMYGLSVVREVIHSFNTNTGFTTSVTPGLIGFSTTQESGLIVSSQNMLMILSMFSAFIQARRELVRNYEHNINIFANFELLRSKYDKLVAAHQLGINLHTAGIALSLASKVNMGYRAFKLAKSLKNLGSFAAMCSRFAGEFKAGVTGIKATLAAIKTGTTAALTPTVVGAIASIIIWAVIDKLLNDFFEWLENKNLICLLPMWWEDYPFVQNTKDGKKILLIDSNATATDEDRTDERVNGIDSDGEFEEG